MIAYIKRMKCPLLRRIEPSINLTNFRQNLIETKKAKPNHAATHPRHTPFPYLSTKFPLRLPIQNHRRLLPQV
jgi:hypothetical protein